MNELSRVALLAGAAAAAVLAGCVREIVGVDGKPISPGAGGSGGARAGVSTHASSTVVTAAAGGATSPTALVLMAPELPSSAMPCGNNACTPPSDTMFLAVASAGNTCQDPRGATVTSGNDWQRIIGLPAKDQAVGIYGLSDAAISFEGEEHIRPPATTSVISEAAGGFTGQGAGQGTIEIMSIDKKQVTFRLTGAGLNLSEDGVYVAVRCTPLP